MMYMRCTDGRCDTSCGTQILICDTEDDMMLEYSRLLTEIYAHGVKRVMSGFYHFMFDTTVHYVLYSCAMYRDRLISHSITKSIKKKEHIPLMYNDPFEGYRACSASCMLSRKHIRLDSVFF